MSNVMFSSESNEFGLCCAVDVVEGHGKVALLGGLNQLRRNRGRNRLPVLIEGDIALTDAQLYRDFRLSEAKSLSERLESVHAPNISRPDAIRQQSDCLQNIRRAYIVPGMPAKPLSAIQRADATRLKAFFKMWQLAKKKKGEPWSQEDVSDEFEFGQSALSQYLNGNIPLNADVLLKFSRVLGVPPASISPSIVEHEQKRASTWTSVKAVNFASADASSDRSGLKKVGVQKKKPGKQPGKRGQK